MSTGRESGRDFEMMAGLEQSTVSAFGRLLTRQGRKEVEPGLPASGLELGAHEQQRFGATRVVCCEMKGGAQVEVVAAQVARKCPERSCC